MLGKPLAEQGTLVPKAFLELLDSQEEFPLTIDGGKGLPHDATVLSVDSGAMRVVLKTFRPMPPKLASGASCHVSVTAFEEHWKAKLAFIEREAYLQYSFELPKSMEKSGRREHKRYQFRPRENVLVQVQDSSLPGMAFSGTLFDLSEGGMVFRPDRAYRIGDKVVLKLDTAMFHRGKSFPLIRIRGLPGMKEALVVRGDVAHSSKRGNDIFVAFAFGALAPDMAKALASTLRGRNYQSDTASQSAPQPKQAMARRRHTRFTYRPRESAQVRVQNDGLPGVGAEGPLTDLSSGGMVFRADRAFRIGDGAPILLDANLFEKGATFPVIRIDRLKGYKGQMRLRGDVAHVTRRGDDVFVAIAFGALEPMMADALQKTLGARQKSRLRFTYLRYLTRPFSE